MKKTKNLPVIILTFIMALGILTILPADEAKAQNPYIPLYEHLPDGEPKLFEDPDNPGKYRAYIYGSHDINRKVYCGPDIRAWSAPVEDLSDWRDEGPIYMHHLNINGTNTWNYFFAPDIAEVVTKDGTKEYYLYPHDRGSLGAALVCKSSRPDGPFVPINTNSEGTSLEQGSFIGFDPGVWVEQLDENSQDLLTDPPGTAAAAYEQYGFRAWVYYGFQGSSAAELDQETMWKVKPGTSAIPDFMPSSTSYGSEIRKPNIPYPYIFDPTEEHLRQFNFFEASSIRKVGNKYVMVYSGHSGPDYGMGSTNSALRYCYGDSPLGPWKNGGVLVDSRGPVPNQNGTGIVGTTWGHNTHGSILEINNQWYVFYHRPPGGRNGARQPVVAPIKIKYDEEPVANGGEVVIRAYDPYSEDNTWTAKGGSHEYTGAEITSEGFHMFGLDPYKYYSVGIASYVTGIGSIQDSYDIWDNHMPITGVGNNFIAGFKYFGFEGLESDDRGIKAFEGTKQGNNTKFNLFLTPRTNAAFKINVWLDGPWANNTWNGTKIGEINVPANSERKKTKFDIDVSSFVDDLDGKHAIYLVAEGSGTLCDLMGLGFSKGGEPLEAPIVPEVSISLDGTELSLPITPLPADQNNTIPGRNDVSLNGITEYDMYDCTPPAELTSVPVVTASASEKDVKVLITQADSLSGIAYVKFDYKGVVKTYRIPFDNQFYTRLEEFPSSLTDVEEVANIIGDQIVLYDVDSYNDQQKVAKIKETLNKNEQIKALGVDIEVSSGNGMFSVTLTKGGTVMTIPSLSVKASKKYTITLNPNGGTLPDPTKASFDVDNEDPIGDLPIPSKDEYIFTGWYTASTGGNKISSETIVTENATYYAQYTEKKYTVTFDPNSGTLSATEKTKTANSGSAIGTLPTPTLSGYTFNGWYTAKTGGIKVTTAEIVKADLTLYAQWTKNTNPTKPVESTGPAKGKSFNSNNIKYKITKQAIGKTPGTVQLTAPLKKKIKSITVTAAVKSGSFTYNVETIANNAFKGCKSLSKVTIGNNVIKIGSKAFSGASKLKSINITSKKLKSVGKNALKGIHKKAKIKVPSAKYSAYKKLLSSKGQRKTVKIKK